MYTVLLLIFFFNLTIYPRELSIHIRKLMHSFQRLHRICSMDVCFSKLFTIINYTARKSLYICHFINGQV